MKLKEILKKITDWVKNLYQKTDDDLKKYVPIAINIVNGIKKFMDSPADDVILSLVEMAIPNGATVVMIEKIKATVKEWIPKILLDLQIANSIANLPNVNDQLQAVLNQIKLSSDETKTMLYRGLASTILFKLSDGKLTLAESYEIEEYYYKNFLNK
jgi:light-regulated signal transduction histidine kinase (bacteriophytochrome)